MEPVPDLVDVVAADLGVIGEGEIDPVSDLEDLVALDGVPGGIPQVDPISPVGFDEVEAAGDGVVDDPYPLAGLDIDSMQGLGDGAIPDHDVISFDEDAGHILGQMRPGLRDGQTVDHGAGGPDVNDHALISAPNR